MGSVSNKAYIEASEDQANAMRLQAGIDAAITAALYLWQRNASGSISDMQAQTSKRYQNLANQLHDHAKKFWPYEKEYVDDAFGLAHNDPQYSALSNTWASFLDTSNESHKKRLNETLALKCLATSTCEEVTWKRNYQLSRAGLISFADRHAENRADALNDQRYARQYAALKLGRGHLETAESYAAISGAAGLNRAQILTDTFDSAWTAYGLYRRRTDNWGSDISQFWEIRQRADATMPNPYPNSYPAQQSETVRT